MRNDRYFPIVRLARLSLLVSVLALTVVGCRHRGAPAPGAAPAGIQVLFKLDSRLLGPTHGGERWVSAPTYGPVRQAGDTYVLEARAEALDDRGQPRAVSFTWQAEKPDLVTVMPGAGEVVTITIQGAGESCLEITAAGLTKELYIKSTYESDTITVEIAQ